MKKRALTLALLLILLPGLCGCGRDASYRHAVKLMDSGEYSEAVEIFSGLGTYRRSEEHIDECEVLAEEASKEPVYAEGIRLLEGGSTDEALELLTKVRGYEDTDSILYDIVSETAATGDADEAWRLYEQYGERGAIPLIGSPISACGERLIAIDDDGKLLCWSGGEGNNAEVWNSVTERLGKLTGVKKAVLGGDMALVLFDDNRAVCIGKENTSLKNTSINLTGVADISCSGGSAVGVAYLDGSADGIDVYTRTLLPIDFSDWSDIVSISAGSGFYIGLTKDGYIKATGQNGQGQTEITLWNDIIQLAAGDSHSAALTGEGKVLCSGSNSYGQCNTENWQDVVYIAASGSRTAAVTGSGRVLCTGSFSEAEVENIENMRNIRYIALTEDYLYAVNTNGKVKRSDSTEALENTPVAEWRIK